MQFTALRIYDAQPRPSARYQRMSLHELTPGEVVVRVYYSSVNYKDALACTGAAPIVRKYPLNAGIDLAGVVEHSNSPHVSVGQWVLATGCGLSETLDGGYAELARLPASAVIPMPHGWSAEDVMTLGTAGFTAALAIHRLEHNGLVPAQGPVAVTGASGGVGCIAIAMLAARGYDSVALTSRESQRATLLALGAKDVLLTQTLPTGTAPLEKMRFAAAIDNVGVLGLSWLIRSLSMQGAVASIGLTDGNRLDVSVMPFILRGVNVLGINSAATPRALRETVWGRIATDLRPANISALRWRTIEFSQLLGVLPEFLAHQVQGRTVVRMA